jgi:serine/threonine protein phosphatase 1
MFRGLFQRRGADRADTAQRVTLEQWPDAVYAIGDVHGCLDLLRDLHDQILADASAQTKLIVMLGDYVDRGPDSAGVLDFLAAPLPPGVRRICLAGNHEAMMLGFLADPTRSGWLNLGGEETLRSYQIDLDTFLSGNLRVRQQMLHVAIPSDHLAFLHNLPVMLTLPGYVFVHAGLRHGVPLEQQTTNDLLWIREEFHDVVDRLPAGPFVTVHGHTPAREPILNPRRICVDTGAYVHGRLTAVRLRQDAVPELIFAR